MIVYTFDNTLDGLLSAVFDAFNNHEMPNDLLTAGNALPLFCDHIHEVHTDENKSQRVWKGLENKLSHLGLSIITISFLSEETVLNYPLFTYICKAFTNTNKISIERNFSDPDVLFCTQTYRRVCYEAKRMKQFLRFQKAKDGTYLGVIQPDHNVLPLIIDHFKDRFNDQSFLIFDARRRYGFYYDKEDVNRITFCDDQALPFDFTTGKMDADILSDNDKMIQDLWKTYFKAICIKERLNPKKQAGDMPRRYWRYMTEKQN